MMTRNRLAAWMLLLMLGVVDWIWSMHAGLTFIGWPLFGLYLGGVAGVGIFYDVSGRSEGLANVGHQTALWLFFSAVGIIFTYDAASLRRPLIDAQLAAFDAAMGFDWVPWFRYTELGRVLPFLSAIAYGSLVPQIFLTVFYLALIGRNDRNGEFLWTAVVSLIVCTLLSGLYPAVGPCTHFFGVEPRYVQHLLEVRGGEVKLFSLNHMEGIITWPSFHTVIAILVPYVHRPPLRTFVPVMVLNLAMLISIPANGCHYLSDVVAGVIVAVAGIAMVRGAISVGLLSEA